MEADQIAYDTSVEVQPTHGEAHVSLTVPSNEITGIVVDRRGEPVAAAHVTLRAAIGVHSDIRSERDGTFRFRGVDTGEVFLSANRDSADESSQSDEVLVRVEEKGSFGPVQLVLFPSQRLTGTVRSSGGPIAGAHLSAMPVGTDQPLGAAAVTDGDGYFVLNVAGKAQRAMIAVRAPGYALRVFDVPLPNHGAVLNVPEVGGELDVAFGREVDRGSQMIFAFQDDRYLPFGELYTWAKSHGMELPSDHGYHFPDMAPAHYTVCVIRTTARGVKALTSNSPGAKCADGFLAPFGTLTIELPEVP